MKIIDTHVHFQPASKSLANTAKQLSKVDFSAAGLASSLARNNIEQIILIGLKDISTGLHTVLDVKAENPMLPDTPDEKLQIKYFPVAGINPHRKYFDEIKEAARLGKLKGLKIWLGYYHVAATDKRYEPFYEIASEYHLPIIFHTGDTYSKVAKVKYSQPLQIDEIAVDFPDLKLVMAHIGNPDVMSAAQVLYKNDNVFADLSGLIVGAPENFESREAEKAQKRLQDCFDFVANPEKFMFGSDWPLADQGTYVDFVNAAIPEEYHEAVFYNNAKRIFGL